MTTRMKARLIIAILPCCLTATAAAQMPVDTALAAFIAGIRAVDNHAHPNSAAPGDSEYDALPLDGIPSSPWPFRLRPENPEYLDAYRAVYGYQWGDLGPAHLAELRARVAAVHQQQGDSFPNWALDRMGTEVMFANR